MKNKPGAFLSYARSDDDHNNGHITSIREKLAGEIQAQTGDPFEIFQDRKDIRWGEQWKRRIDETLDATTLLIPILTPSFFKSDPCRDELRKFLEREKQLSRDDLILPILYIRCPVLEEKALREADPLAKLLAERNYLDWREIRFDGIDTANVRKMIASMAMQVCEAIERSGKRMVTSVSHVDSGAVGGKKHPDDRLNHVIDFGSTIAEVAQRFRLKMDEFNSIDGSGPNKFLELGAHAYSCAALAIENCVDRSKLSPDNRNYLKRIAEKLRELAASTSGYLRKPFTAYWEDGTRIAEELNEHVRYLARLSP